MASKEKPTQTVDELLAHQDGSKAIVAKIERLEDELARLAKEKKRTQEDIDALYALLKRRIKNPTQTEMKLDIVEGGVSDA